MIHSIMFKITNHVLKIFGRIRFLTTTVQNVKDLIEKSPQKVVVFMKGHKDAPKCGFSNAVVKILEMHGVGFQDVDVLEDETLRNAIKEYSNWPTIPQVYINKEFYGGCDILMQMHKNGELVKELKKNGIISQLSDDVA